MIKPLKIFMLLLLAAGSVILVKADERTVEISSTPAVEPDLAPAADSDPAQGQYPHGVKVEFNLVNRDGNRVTQEDFLGKYVLITFGYTHCEHICPMILSNMARTLKASNNRNAGIFISVDTERDTPEIVDDFAAGFNKNITGLTGSFTDVSITAENFKVGYSVMKTQKRYVVQHSTDIFYIGPDGQLLDIFTFNTLPQSLTN